MPARPDRRAPPAHGTGPSGAGDRPVARRCSRTVGAWGDALRRRQPPASRRRPRGDRRVARRLRRRRRRPRAQPGPLPADAGARAGPPVTRSTSRPPCRRPYVNTIPSDAEPDFPGDEYLERRIRAFIRWNAAVMVVRANIRSEAIGGHLATYASSAALYEVGLQPLLPGQGRRAAGRPGLLPGPRLPGHLRPGLRRGPADRGPARQLPVRGGRRRALLLPPPPADARVLGVPDGLDGARARSTPSPRPTWPATCDARGLADTSHSRVWCFVGDGEFDEPETIGPPRHGRPGAPRQPDLRGQLQPPAARRPGPGQRQGHPGVRGHSSRGPGGT